MTVFDGWLKACKEMNQKVTLMMKGENSYGDRLCLYSLIRRLPSIPDCNHCWINNYEEYYIVV